MIKKEIAQKMKISPSSLYRYFKQTKLTFPQKKKQHRRHFTKGELFIIFKTFDITDDE